MSRDWLIDADRGDRARERLLSEAAVLIARGGLEEFDLAELSRRAHCSRATVYRHTGGKRRIVEDLLSRASRGIVATVRREVEGLEGGERVARALQVAFDALKADPVTLRFVRSRHALDGARRVVDSDMALRTAAELLGLDLVDRQAARFVVSALISRLVWPPREDDDTEGVRWVQMLVAAVYPAAPVGNVPGPGERGEARGSGPVLG